MGRMHESKMCAHSLLRIAWVKGLRRIMSSLQGSIQCKNGLLQGAKLEHAVWGHQPGAFRCEPQPV